MVEFEHIAIGTIPGRMKDRIMLTLGYDGTITATMDLSMGTHLLQFTSRCW